MVKRQTYKRGVSIDQETATVLMAWYRADFLPTYLPLSEVGSRYLALVADCQRPVSQAWRGGGGERK